MVDGGELIVPRRLQPGGLVRVVSPSLPALGMARARRERAISALRALGYAVDLGQHSLRIGPDASSAGTGEERASDIHDAFLDPAVDAVVSAAGGATTSDVIPFLDADLLRAHAKPFLGYSDNVWINAFLWRRCGMVSYTGACLMTHFGEQGGPFSETLARFDAALGGEGPIALRSAGTYTWSKRNWLSPADDAKLRPRDVRLPDPLWLRDGLGAGPIIGGELRVLLKYVSVLNLSVEGTVLMWDLSQPTAALADLAEGLLAVPGVTQLAGMIVGWQRGVEPDAFLTILREVLEPGLADTKFPIVVGGDGGHYEPSWIVPFGATALLDARSRSITVKRP